MIVRRWWRRWAVWVIISDGNGRVFSEKPVKHPWHTFRFMAQQSLNRYRGDVRILLASMDAVAVGRPRWADFEIRRAL